MAVLPALLLEAALYIAPGFPAVRERAARLGRALTAALAASAVAPYLIVSLALGSFRIEYLGALLVLSLIVGLWYRLAPRGILPDLLFLGLMAGVYLSPIFKEIYINPAGKPALDILGKMMWIRIGIAAVLLIRGVEGVEFGFVPRRNDWLVGGRYFLYLIPFVLPLALSTDFIHYKSVAFSGRTVLAALGTFLGMLWVVALAEEFFFRGLLQPWMQRITGSFAGGIAIASLTFGAAHLTQRGFPNWRFAAVATVAGIFYGLAFARAGSIRASMVTHALLNTTWRIFFT